MAKGISLHIGVKECLGDPPGNTLSSPENNAKAMADIARAEGYLSTEVMLTRAATRANLVNKLDNIINELKVGDTFFLSFSGHGGQQEDGAEDGRDEDDFMDEYWCLNDCNFLDDEIRDYLRKIDKGVKVIIVSASCHSGSVDELYQKKKQKQKHLPHKKEIFKNSFKFSILFDPLIKADVLLLFSCEDSQLTADGFPLNPFTALVVKHWNNGAFEGNYAEFAFKILYDSTDYTQRAGVSIINDHSRRLLNCKPFKL